MLEFKNDFGKIMYCEEEDGTLYIDFIEVHKKNEGHGTRLLKRFIDKVFAVGGYMSIGLICAGDYGVKIDVLEHFYNKFGFEIMHKNSFGNYMVMKK